MVVSYQWATVAQVSSTLCTLPRAVRQACSCGIVARTSEGGEKAKLFGTRWHMQGVFQQNSLFDQLVQTLSVKGRCVFLACQFKEFVSNSLIIKLLEESMTQLFLVSLFMRDNPMQLMLSALQVAYTSFQQPHPLNPKYFFSVEIYTLFTHV